jgi:hypothetical protein
MGKKLTMIKFRILSTVIALTAGATAFCVAPATAAVPPAAKTMAAAPKTVKGAGIILEGCSSIDTWGVQEFLTNGGCIAYGGYGISTLTYTQYAYWVNGNNNYGTIEFNKDHNLYTFSFSPCSMFIFNADSPNSAQVQQIDISGWVPESDCDGDTTDSWTIYKWLGPGVGNYEVITEPYYYVFYDIWPGLPQG